jgi:hypothetical protein
MRDHERWIWTELIAFDNTDDDFGVGEYIATAGFTPDAICLLLTSPDFILAFEPVAEEVVLPADYCARDGHEFNQQRARQDWTNHQLRALIENLRKRGVAVYVTVFTRFYGDRFHHEWLSDHREVCKVYREAGWTASLNPLARLADGTYFQDIFAAKLVATIQWYGFDGWHGADGWGPHNGPLWRVDASDDTIVQFAEMTAAELPDIVTRACVHDIEKLEQRMAWIWKSVRREWIEFNVQRWTDFWQKMVEALHAVGKKAVINSSWGRAPWESLYRYGIDYRRIFASGVDAMVVETVAAGLAMDPRPGTATPERHYDFLSMLMLIRAYVPEMKLIFLQNAHDVVEEWDAIRHLPTLLEKEIYALNNIFHVTDSGALQPSADGFLVCLGDGLTDGHWDWLRQRWEQSLGPVPTRSLGATVLWSDHAMQAQVDEFTHTRACNSHRLITRLMSRGPQVHATVRVEDLDVLSGPLLVPNPHLLAAAELDAVRAYRGGPVICVGGAAKSLGEPDMAFSDVCEPGAFTCAVFGVGNLQAPTIAAIEPEVIPPNMLAVEDLGGYWDHMYMREVSDSFLDACADVITRVCGGVRITEEQEYVRAMAVELPDGTLRIALKNDRDVYSRPVVAVDGEIDHADIVTEFPAMAIRPEGSMFSVRVPGKGITVVDVHLKSH